MVSRMNHSKGMLHLKGTATGTRQDRRGLVTRRAYLYRSRRHNKMNDKEQNETKGYVSSCLGHNLNSIYRLASLRSNI